MADTIRDRLKEAEFVYSADKVLTAAFRERDGAGTASVRFATAISSGQMDAIRASDTWRLADVRPVEGGVHARLVEQLEEPRDRPAADESTA